MGNTPIGHKKKRTYHNGTRNITRSIRSGQAGRHTEINGGVRTKYIYNINQLLKDVTRVVPELDKPCGVWIWGPAGSGKSTLARTLGAPIFDKSIDKWWERYKDEPIVLIDDLHVRNARGWSRTSKDGQTNSLSLEQSRDPQPVKLDRQKSSLPPNTASRPCTQTCKTTKLSHEDLKSYTCPKSGNHKKYSTLWRATFHSSKPTKKSLWIFAEYLDYTTIEMLKTHLGKSYSVITNELRVCEECEECLCGTQE